MKIETKITEIAPASAAKTSGAEETKKNKFSVRLCDWIISLSLVLIFFGFPVFFTGVTFQGVSFEKQIYFYFWTLLALAAWAIKCVIVGEMKVRRTPLDIPIIAFLAAYALSSFFSKDHWHSFWGFFGDPSRGLASAIMVVAVYYMVFSNLNAKKFKLFLIGLVFANLIAAIWTTLAISGIKFIPDKIAQFAPLSLTGSFTGLSVYFSIMIPLLIVAVFLVVQNAKNKIVKWASVFLILANVTLNLFLLLALYAFIAWISWIALLAGVAVVLIYALSKIVKLPNFSWVWLPIAIFIVILVFIMSGQFLDIAKINLPAEVSLNYSTSWSIARDAVKNGFSAGAIGSGPATYGYNFSLFRPKEFNLNALYNLRFFQGTGIPFESLPTIGVIGVIFLLILVLSFLSIGFYLLNGAQDGEKFYSLGFFSSSLIFLINAFSVRIESAILLLGALISAVALAALLKESDSLESYLNLSLKVSPKFALALAFIFMVVASGVTFLFIFIGKVFMADAYFGLTSRSREVNEDILGKMRKAVNLYGHESRYFIRLSQAYAVLANQEALKEDREKDAVKIQGYLNDSVAAAKRAKSMSDSDVTAAENLAQIYENAGFYAADFFSLAEDSYKRALELEPHNPNFFVKLGQIKISRAGTKDDEKEKKTMAEEAKNLFQKSIDEKADFDPGYYNLALAEETLGNLDGAVNNAAKAYSINRNNVGYAFVLGRLHDKRGKDDDNKIAESLFKQILAVNNKEINTHFYLGMLYEKTNENSKAIDEYQKIIDLLPSGVEETKNKISGMIENVRSGSGNLQVGAGQIQAREQVQFEEDEAN